jgi:response regulator RpfG family c-di-GMP phosphodiesterase
MIENKIRPVVLVIDDEEENCKLFLRMLRRDFKVITALSGEEGVQYLLQNDQISVLVVDMRLPGMQGNDFLVRAMEIRPDAIGIIVTGYADSSAAISAINDGHAFSYLSKPVEQNTFLDVVARAYRLFEVKKLRRHVICQLEQKKDTLSATVRDLLNHIQGN